MKNLIIIESTAGHRGEMTVKENKNLLKLVKFEFYDENGALLETLKSGSVYRGVTIFEALMKTHGIKEFDIEQPDCKNRYGAQLASHPAFRTAFRCSGCLTPLQDRGTTGNPFSTGKCPNRIPTDGEDGKAVFDCLYKPHKAKRSRFEDKSGICW